MADPVAAKSTSLCMYMSTHPDTLVAYAKHFGQIDAHILSAKMVSIDSKGMNLEYKVKGRPDKAQRVLVEFDPPLAGYEEVKPRLLSMKADADEALGTVKAPQITHFEVPRDIWITGVLLALLVYGTYVPPNSTSAFWWLARFLRSTIVPDWYITGSWWFVYIAHSLEALYTTSLVYKHRTPLHIGAAWVFANLIFGYPVIARLRLRIKEARINSIMKGN
ncbi:hypothetical protein BC834DRAFT_827346 [Gloeopeniophorella convolvens]|nr:hypothetical protein BC834DRAFT_827346 [Gloeopeniophorella convolvens]